MPDPADPAGHSRTAEILMRAALCAIVALLVSLGWIMTTPIPSDEKVLAVTIVLATTAALLLFAGHTRAEGDKTRAAARLAVEMATQGIQQEIRDGLAVIATERQARESAGGPSNVVRLPSAETREAVGRLQSKINGDSRGDTLSNGNG